MEREKVGEMDELVDGREELHGREREKERKKDNRESMIRKI